MSNVGFAFLLTLIAGASTGIGSALALFSKTGDKRFLSVSLGFSAGVMIYVSLVEILYKAKSALSVSLGEKNGALAAISGFFFGMLIIGIIDKLIPAGKDILDPRSSDSAGTSDLMRTGVFTALAISIHNFPEGLATFVSALQGTAFAAPIVAAIAIHNIPEGIAVSVPIYYATGSKKKAFMYSFASGLTEPVGALMGYLILMPFMGDIVYGMLFSIVAGIMVFISVDELLPSAIEYNGRNLSIRGLMAGMAVMAVSLWMLL